jgi:AcrR family transcriptional regulator
MKQGFDRTSVRELIGACGMSSGTLYHYIGAKDDIIRMICDVLTASYVELYKDLGDRTRALGPTDALKASVKTFLEFVDEFQDTYNFINHAILNLAQDDRQPMYDAYDALIGYFEMLLKNGVDKGEFDTCDTKIVACDMSAICLNWAYRRWYLRKHFTLEEYGRKQVELLLRALRAGKSAAGRSRDSQRYTRIRERTLSP